MAEVSHITPGIRMAARSPRANALAIGVFDGVHTGHVQMLRSMVRACSEKGMRPIVLTFDPHPEAVVRGSAPPVLTSLREKQAIMARLGIEELIVLQFTKELAAMPPGAFVEEVLWPRWQPAEVYVGFNFTFGWRASGNPQVLRELGERLGFRVHVFPPVLFEGEPISSTAIRRMIVAGEVERAAQALGRPYSLPGRVVRGDGRGATLGYPTANVLFSQERCVPGVGVYAVMVAVGGGTKDVVGLHLELPRGALQGIANLGLCPTFRPGAAVEANRCTPDTLPQTVHGTLHSSEQRTEGPRLEVHLLDFQGSLYGQEIRVFFISRLRDELAFASAEDLKRQIEADINIARRVLSKRDGSGACLQLGNACLPVGDVLELPRCIVRGG